MIHSQSLGKELLLSLPIKVRFAGFESDTLKLAHAGWDLSMRQDLNPRFYCPTLQLAIRHGAHLYGLSQPIEINYGEFRGSLNDAYAYATSLSSQCFEMQYMSSDIRIATQHSNLGMSFKSSFHPIDPYPQVRTSEESIKDFKFFKVSNPSIQDIIVDPSQVSELLEMVLKAQAPMVDQIRARERSRANTQWVREELNVKPAHQIQAQLITLAS